MGDSCDTDQLRLWSSTGTSEARVARPWVCAGTNGLSPLPRTLCSCPPPPDPWSPFSFEEEPGPCRHVAQGSPARCVQ